MARKGRKKILVGGELDVIRDRESLLPLYTVRRMFKLKATWLYYWWRFGVMDPADHSRQLYLATCHNGRERCTTLEAYRAFCRARDVAYEKPKK